MSLPNSELAWVPKGKLVNYLLSSSHPTGKFKAAFFQAIGYEVGDVDTLEAELLAIARDGTLEQESITTHGTKFVVRGKLNAPRGVTVEVRTVWIVEREARAPRFITAYPV